MLFKTQNTNDNASKVYFFSTDDAGRRPTFLTGRYPAFLWVHWDNSCWLLAARRNRRLPLVSIDCTAKLAKRKLLQLFFRITDTTLGTIRLISSSWKVLHSLELGPGENQETRSATKKDILRPLPSLVSHSCWAGCLFHYAKCLRVCKKWNNRLHAQPQQTWNVTEKPHDEARKAQKSRTELESFNFLYFAVSKPLRLPSLKTLQNKRRRDVIRGRNLNVPLPQIPT